MKRAARAAWLAGAAALGAGCGGGHGSGNPVTETIGGNVTGLTGGGLVLQDNGAADVPVPADGAFIFATPIAVGKTYHVTVRTQPSNPAQTCLVANASGTVDRAVSSVSIVCTSNGITLLAGQLGGPGYLDGSAANARFKDTAGLTVDPFDNLWLTDQAGTVIRRLSPAGDVTTVAGSTQHGSIDGAGPGARFSAAAGIASDPAGNLFIADSGNLTIRKMTPAGVVTTFAGSFGAAGTADGVGAAAQFSGPMDAVSDASGNLYITDLTDTGTAIRKITPGAAVSTLVPAALRITFGAIAADAAGDPWSLDDTGTLDVVTPPLGAVTALAGGSIGFSDGIGAAAQFGGSGGVAFGPDGNAYVADRVNSTIRQVTPAGRVTTIAGQAGVHGYVDGSGSAARLDSPGEIAADSHGNLFIIDQIKQVIRKVTVSGTVSLAAGAPLSPGFADGRGPAAQFSYPHGAAVDGAGNIFIADTFNNRIRKVTFTGVASTLAGSGSAGAADGVGASAQFNGPTGVATGADGTVYVADTANHSIRKISPDGTVSTLAGSQPGYADGAGAAAEFYFPGGVAVGADGSVLVADSGNNVIRHVTPAGVVTTCAGIASAMGGYADGAATSAQFNDPVAVALDASGNLWVSDSQNRVVRQVTPDPDAQVSTIAGMPLVDGYADGPVATAQFSNLGDIAVDMAGNAYVADVDNDVIRKIDSGGTVSTVVGVNHSVGVALGPLPGSLSTALGLGLAFVTNSAASLVVVDRDENAVLLVNLP